MRFIFSIILLAFCDFSKSQNANLVMNPSFEEFTVCPDYQNGAYYFNFTHLPNWNDVFYNTPDYFNVCSPIEPTLLPEIDYPLYGVPRNGYGYQFAKSGNAYCGISTYYVGQPHGQEYISGRFSSKLVERKKYIVSLYCSLPENVQYSTSKLGIYITNELPIYNNNNLWAYTPNIINNSEFNPLVDTANWMLIQDTFFANGEEEFIVIGNFNLNNNDTVKNSYLANLAGAYYYIDDVSVIELDTTISIYEPEQTSFQIYPNPAQNTIAIKNKKPVSVSIYSLSGALLFSKSIRKDEEIDISGLSNGVYMVAVENKRQRLVVCR